MQKLVRKYEDLHMIVTEDDAGLKDGVVYLFFPKEATVLKPILLRVYSIVFAADETHLLTTKRPYLAFAVHDIFRDGMSMNELEKY